MSGPQLRRWARALSGGLSQGFGGPNLCLAIQAQLPALAPAQMPAHMPAAQPASAPEGSTLACRAVSLSGVHA